MREHAPAGDVDYAVHGDGYVAQRRTDPRIAAYVHAALGSARTVLNVGAGAGSHEPEDRHVIAIEPSAAMRSQRPPHLVPAIRAVAEDLSLDDRSVDSSMALGGRTRVQEIPIPADCVDGFTEAYYARPEAFLDPAVRRSQSTWSFVPEAEHRRSVEELAGVLRSGEWDRRYGDWRTRPTFLGSLRLIVSEPAGRGTNGTGER